MKPYSGLMQENISLKVGITLILAQFNGVISAHGGGRSVGIVRLRTKGH
jgi:hypothetical protein